MKKYQVSIVSFLWIAFYLFLISPNAFSAEKVIKLRYSTWSGPNHSITTTAEQWGRDLEKRTNGGIKVTVFSAGVISAPTLVYDGLVKSAFDLGSSVFAYSTGRFPLTEVLDLPLGCKDGYQSTMMANAWFNKFRSKLKEYDDVKMLYLYGPGPTLFQTKKKISSTDEIKGMRIRSSGQSAKIVEALGGVAVTITLPDTYEALQKGLADGILNPTPMLQIFKFGPLLPYTLEDYGVASIPMCYVAMNKNKWNSLPKNVQEVIEQLNQEAIERLAKANLQEDKDAEVYLAQVGHNNVKVTKDQEAKTKKQMKPVLDAYVENMKAKHLPGEESLKFCLEYVKKN